MSSAAHQPEASVAGPAGLDGVIRVLAVLGLGLSAVLTYQAFSADPLPGCGGDSACAEVLISRWAYWLTPRVSVAVVALLLWLVIVAAAWVAKLEKILAAAALLAAGSAVWFIVVQSALLRQWCVYCTATHGCALALAAIVLIRRRGVTLPGSLAAAAGVAALVVGQLAFPVTLAQIAADRTPPEQAEPRLLTTGEVSIDLDQFPLLGAPDAPHQLAVFFDYTCHHCRQLHDMLDRVRVRYGPQIAIAAIPAPINTRCNPRARRTPTAHFNACRVAKIALAVWIADPERFEAMDAFLFGAPFGRLRGVDEVRPMAVELIGEPALIAALQDERLDPLIAAGGAHSHAIGEALDPPVGALLPKLLLGNGHVIVRLPASAEILFAQLEKQLGVVPLGAPAARAPVSVEPAPAPAAPRDPA